MEKEPIILKQKDALIVKQDWGELRWYANRQLGNSAEMTVGVCVIRPGQKNPRHMHPNCTEVLVVSKGKIKHTAAGGDMELNEGDTITVPPYFMHRAENIGKEDAVLNIAFSSADRKTEGE
jgi:quercetin dioxygenase-like cupin family protein